MTRFNPVSIKVHPEFKKQLILFQNKFQKKGVKLGTAKTTLFLTKNRMFKKIMEKESNFRI